MSREWMGPPVSLEIARQFPGQCFHLRVGKTIARGCCRRARRINWDWPELNNRYAKVVLDGGKWADLCIRFPLGTCKMCIDQILRLMNLAANFESEGS